MSIFGSQYAQGFVGIATSPYSAATADTLTVLIGGTTPKEGTMYLFDFIIVYTGVSKQQPDGTYEKYVGAEVVTSGYVVARDADHARILATAKHLGEWADAKLKDTKVIVRQIVAL